MSNNYKYPYEAQQKINDLERKLEASRQECERLREGIDKNIKTWEGILQELYEDGGVEGESDFFYRMNLKEQTLSKRFIRRLDRILTTKSKGGK